MSERATRILSAADAAIDAVADTLTDASPGASPGDQIMAEALTALSIAYVSAAKACGYSWADVERIMKSTFDAGKMANVNSSGGKA
jgi:hypothetical protein